MKLKRILFFNLIAASIFSGCIKDDIINDTIDPVIRITTPVDSIAINTQYQFKAKYLNNIGVQEMVVENWASSNSSIVSISANGLANALQKGSVVISVSYDNGVNLLKDSLAVSVGNSTVNSGGSKSGTIATTSTYKLTGDFEVNQNGTDLLIEIAENYEASTSLPGLYVYLTNNRNSVANAYEIGAVQVYSGAHAYTIPNVDIDEYQYLLYFCKPFNVKVGDGEIQ